MKQIAVDTVALLKFFLISVPLACMLYAGLSLISFLKNIRK
jgi:hypothetical protein